MEICPFALSVPEGDYHHDNSCYNDCNNQTNNRGRYNNGIAVVGITEGPCAAPAPHRMSDHHGSSRHGDTDWISIIKSG